MGGDEGSVEWHSKIPWFYREELGIYAGELLAR